MSSPSILFRVYSKGYCQENTENAQSRKVFIHHNQFSHLMAAGHVEFFTISIVGTMSRAYEARHFSELWSQDKYPQYDAITFDEASQTNDSNIMHVLYIN